MFIRESFDSFCHSLFSRSRNSTRINVNMFTDQSTSAVQWFLNFADSILVAKQSTELIESLECHRFDANHCCMRLEVLTGIVFFSYSTMCFGQFSWALNVWQFPNRKHMLHSFSFETSTMSVETLQIDEAIRERVSRNRKKLTQVKEVCVALKFRPKDSWRIKFKVPANPLVTLRN